MRLRVVDQQRQAGGLAVRKATCRKAIVAGAVGPGRQCGRWRESFGAERILPTSLPTGSEAACTLYFSSDLRVGEPACTIIRGQDKRGGCTRAWSRLE
jgi:hypothetical protein